VFLALVALVFGMVSLAVSSLVESRLVNDRIIAQKKSTSNIAVQIAPYLAESDAGSIYDIISRNGSELGGRFLVLSSSGIVQVDSFSQFNGRRLYEREINDILYRYNDSAHGFHKVQGGSGGTFWTLYTTSSIISNGEIVGVLLYSASISDVMRITDTLGMQLLWMYAFACVVVVLASIFFTGLITKPVKELTNVAMKISAGDWSQRAHIQGKSEMAELGDTFNMMCDRLQHIDEQRSQFVSDASHELKTPLASMKILVESMLYQDDVPDEVYKEFLGDINGEIDRLSNLITDLLLLSKMDNDTSLVQLEKVNLSELTEKCFRALMPLAEKKRIELLITATEGVETEGDPLKLRQAIYNLMDNAIKYTPEGGRVEVTVKREGAEAKVEIRDNGLGIGEKHLSHIFEQFYRVDRARARDTGGTGLGLHIVRRIALMHGGRVTVDSKEGAGSTFTLILPLTQEQREQPRQLPETGEKTE